MTFLSLDEKEFCKGIYHNGQLSFDKIPDNLDRTWKYIPYLEDRDIQYGNLYCEGAELSEVCSEELKGEWEGYNKHLAAFINSFKNAKIDFNEHCLYDLIPKQFLLEYCQIKCKIIDDVFKRYTKPKNYDFSLQLEKMLADIKSRKLNIDTSCLKPKLHEEKTRTFLKSLKNWQPYIDFNQFGTITGRLTTKKNTFPILNLNSEFRSIIKPDNDFFLELDFNAAELRTLIFLSGQPQPNGDIHEHNAQRLGVTREEAKRDSFAWLYGSTKVDSSKYDSVFNTKSILEKYYDGETGKVTNYFGREIESDRFHAPNYIVQSSTSDMVLRQALKIYDFLKDKKSKIRMIVHDALAIDVSNSESELCGEIANMFGNNPFGVWPVHASIGKDFGNLKEVKR